MPGAKPKVKPVKLVCGVLFTRGTDLALVDSRLTDEFGQIDGKSKPFDFIFTDYYAPEMGGDLKKQFYSFEKLVMPDCLPDIKHTTIGIEAEFAESGQRKVNIDPGYLEESKLVLASTKNFSHRVYLGGNIWAEVTMRFVGGKFITLEWTYSDWSQELAVEFLAKVRDVYKGQLDRLGE